MSSERWTPTTTNPAPECRCGNRVTQQFIRVFGRNGDLHACLECSTRDALAKGAGADPSFERRVEAPLPDARKQRGDTDRALGGGHR
jgi:hypothetical protein